MKSYLKKDNVAPHNFILDFNVKFPLLRLLQFLSDLKSTILSPLEIVKDVTKENFTLKSNLNKIMLCGGVMQHYLVLNKIST